MYRPIVDFMRGPGNWVQIYWPYQRILIKHNDTGYMRVDVQKYIIVEKKADGCAPTMTTQQGQLLWCNNETLPTKKKEDNFTYEFLKWESSGKALWAHTHKIFYTLDIANVWYNYRAFQECLVSIRSMSEELRMLFVL